MDQISESFLSKLPPPVLHTVFFLKVQFQAKLILPVTVKPNHSVTTVYVMCYPCPCLLFIAVLKVYFH